jgi:hypothetical protein
MDNCVKCGGPMQRIDPDELKKAAAALDSLAGTANTFAWAAASGTALSKLWMLEWYFRGVCVICAPLDWTQAEAQS